VNRYNDSGIVITVHLNTQNILRQKDIHRNQSISLCNDSVSVTTIHETYNDLKNHYNVSAQLIQRLFFLNSFVQAGK
jgi:hypothetical protein